MEDITNNLLRRGRFFPSFHLPSGFSEKTVHWRLLAPALILLGVLTLYPLIHLISLSLQRYNLARPWVPREFLGLGNFIAFFSDKMLWHSLLVTLKLGVATVSIELVVGFIVAWMLSRKLPGSDFFRILFIIPMMVMPVAGGLTWRLMFNANYGAINWILVRIGLEPQIWLGTDLAMVSIIIAATWSSLPFAILLFIVGLQQIPQQYYEAAALDGASAWRTFTHITLPNIRWSILLITIFRLADAIKSFDMVYSLTGGGPGITTQTLAVYIQNTAFTHSELGYATALSLLILFITLVITSPLIKRLNINV